MNPKLIQVTLTKKNVNEKAGVSLYPLGSMVVIAKIAEGGLFESSVGNKAKVGMRVLRIGNIPVNGMDANEAASLIKQAEGDVPFLLAEGSERELSNIHVITAHKSKDGKVGVSFSGEPGFVQVVKIAEGGSFEATELKVGDTLLAINGISLSDINAMQIQDILDQASNPVTLIAGTFSNISTKPTSFHTKMNPKLIQVTLTKKNVNEKAGVSLYPLGSMVVIAKIAEGGLFERSVGNKAKVGMRVLRIGNILVNGMDTNEAASLIKQAEGDVPFLLAEGSEKELSNIHVITAHKSKDGKVGVSFSGEPGYVRVFKIAKSSPLRGAGLEVSDMLLAINDTLLSNMDAAQVQNVIVNASNHLTLVVLRIPIVPIDHDGTYGTAAALNGAGAIVAFSNLFF